jgi:molybdate-binding protein/DNA-binding XRE family transcriptional regulator
MTSIGKQPIPSPITSKVASVRQQRAVSAAALAKAAGVSRQTIYAVEAGTYVPNTVTSLRMARALGVNVSDLFCLADAAEEAQPPTAVVRPCQPFHPGQAVQLCSVDGKLVAAPAEPADWCLPPSDGVMEPHSRVRLHAADADFGKRILLAGCDPAMGLVASYLEARYLEKAGLQVVLLHQNSSRSLHLLKDGFAHVAGSHLGNSNVDAVSRLFPAPSAALISFALWQEGLVTAAGNPKSIRGVADLARRDVRLVNREEGSGTRALLDRCLKRLSLSSAKVRGYRRTATGHLAAAREVASGHADCCLATEAAARLFGLHFIPLESVRYDLALRTQQLDSPALQTFFDAMSQLAFRKMLSGLAGYDTSVTGTRVI